ncbi:tyrosine-type recombinase/integrase [Piscinibacter sp.]|uniref:tyrosine-type recombinase/integrase n=1 Tax=Piscinibacter sp. TaxID=1903157 RepID=UPI002B9F86CA|nr:tyrosine-type recombinase/integrase [Albitalea sp.]HUG21650.1 tyrosine-type recombinase/integrase [Albitalea sp.]
MPEVADRSIESTRELGAWEDIDEASGIVRVQRVRTFRGAERDGSKTHAERDVELVPQALIALKSMKPYTAMKRDEDGEPADIFENPVTRRQWHDERSQRDHYWKPTLKRLKIRARRGYATRHTFATVALMGGVNPAYIAAQLGHASPKTTFDKYARWIDGADAGPVANSMAEIHTFQRYLQPNTPRALGLEQFDAWAATFGETVSALEIAPDGSGYRLNTRFARFINVPDLMGVFCDVSDIRTKEMLNLPVPNLKGGKPRTVTCRPSDALKAFVQSLVKHAERLKTQRIDPKIDNMLNITNEGRKAALDMRLVAGQVRPDPVGKVAKCAHEVHRIWQSTANAKRAQLVFSTCPHPKVAGTQTKSKFIAQVMNGDKCMRSVEDVELATLSYAEVKALASGIPKVIEKAGVDAEIARYASLFSVWRNRRSSTFSPFNGHFGRANERRRGEPRLQVTARSRIITPQRPVQVDALCLQTASIFGAWTGRPGTGHS